MEKISDNILWQDFIRKFLGVRYYHHYLLVLLKKQVDNDFYDHLSQMSFCYVQIILFLSIRKRFIVNDTTT